MGIGSYFKRFTEVCATGRGVILLVCGVLSATAFGEGRPSVSFRYTVLNKYENKQLSDCPGEIDLRRSVETRIGYAPWNANADRRIETTVTAVKNSLKATITLRDARGNLIGRREMQSNEGCLELVSAAALAIAIAIAPVESSSPENASRAPSPPPREDKTPVTPSRTGPSTSVGPAGLLYFGGLGSWGAVPSLTGGLDLGLGIRWGFASLLLGARYDFPGSSSVSPGQIAARRLSGQASACLQYSVLQGCAGISVGAFWSKGIGLDAARTEVSPAVSGWFRIAANIPILPDVSLLLYADLDIPMIRQRIRETGTDTVFWETPPVGAVWGMALTVTFFDGNGTKTTIQR